MYLDEIFSSWLGLMYIVHIFAYYAIFMTKNYINRIRVVLAEKNIANKSLAEKMKKVPPPYQDGVTMKCNRLWKH